MTDVDAKFQAALNVIQNLPKDGPYKPSPTMMLMFYAYYKQATEGKCHKSKPWSFDVINKAKWDAWNRLGSMSKNEAKDKYVVELTKAMQDFPVLSDEQIIEVLPANEQASDFIQSLGQFYEIVDIKNDDMEKLKKWKGKDKLLLNGKSSFPTDNGDKNDDYNYTDNHINPLDHGNSNGFHQNGFSNDDSTDIQHNDSASLNNVDSDEEFLDTTNDPILPEEHRKRDNSSSVSEPSTLSCDESPAKTNVDSPIISNPIKPLRDGGESGTHGIDKSPARSVGFYSNENNDLSNGEKNSPPRNSRLTGDGVNYGLGGSGGSGGNGDPANISEIQERIAVTLLQLQRDMNHVLNRLQTLETITMTKQQSHCCLHNNQTKQNPTVPSWWPFPELSPKTTLLVIMWPIVVRYIFLLMKRRHRK